MQIIQLAFIQDKLRRAALYNAIRLFGSPNQRLVVACSVILALVGACTGQGTMNPDESTTSSSYTVGVYYYPWYGDDFHGGRYLREHLQPPQLPSLGEYDDLYELYRPPEAFPTNPATTSCL